MNYVNNNNGGKKSGCGFYGIFLLTTILICLGLTIYIMVKAKGA